MFKTLRRATLVLALVVLAPTGLLAGPITITFEGLAEGGAVGTSYAGVTFLNATVLRAGSFLNEFEFPPHSGTNAVFDDSGPLSLVFDSPVLSVGGYFTYMMPVTLTAFDALHNPLGTVTSAYLSNLALSGDSGSSPNEFLGLAFSGGISSVLIAGDALGGSFVLDDVTYSAAPVPVPEPAGTAALLSLALGGLHFLRHRLNRRG